MEKIISSPFFFPSVVLLYLFVFFLIVLVVSRKTTKYLIEDIGLLGTAKHVIVIWIVIFIFSLCYLIARLTGKLEVRINHPIPWKENRIACIGNHAMPKLQDTFLMPLIIFCTRLANLMNPIRYFPFTLADNKNFSSQGFFKKIVGTGFLEDVDRTSPRKFNVKAMLQKWTIRIEQFACFVANIEGGRTHNAQNHLFGKEGSVLGYPKRTVVLLAMETKSLIVPYWGRITVSSRNKFHPMNIIWGLIRLPFIRQWKSLKLDSDNPVARPATVIWGLLEILLKPGVKVWIDINHPEGAITPIDDVRKSKDFTKEVAKKMLEVGDYQLKRIQSRK